MFERLAAKSQNSIEKVSVKNVMNPLLWICALISSPALVIIYFSQGEIHWVINLLATAPPLMTIFFYGYFAFTNPDRLQSESFQLKKQVIELIEEKGSIKPIDARGLQVISNPDILKLDDNSKSNGDETVSDEVPE